MGDAYKVRQLKKMLAHEESKTEEHYGARLTHWYGDTNTLTIDAGGLRALIRHYQKHSTNLENDNEYEDKLDGCVSEKYDCDACCKNGDCIEQGIDGQPRWMEGRNDGV